MPAIRRPSRIERKISAAGFPHGQRGDHEIEGPLQAKRHRDFRPDAQRVQVPGQAAGSLVEIGVGEHLAVDAHQRGRIRMERRGRVNQLRQAQAPRADGS